MLVIDGQEHVPLPVGSRVHVLRAPVTFKLARVAGACSMRQLPKEDTRGVRRSYNSPATSPGEAVPMSVGTL